LQVKLAYQLLQIADMFVDNDSQFALYWTDLDPDNVMVDSSGQLLIVDVENIIVVDRWQINRGLLLRNNIKCLLFDY
jgi:hypothetical protein